MRLYLSSFRNGDHVDVLTDLASRGTTRAPRALVVANAIDAAHPDDRAVRVRDELDRLAEIGVEPSELDLRRYLGGAPDELGEAVAGCDLLWLRGGNAFVLRHALAVSGLDRLLPALLADDALVVGGYSAGPCVLGPHLRGLEACDPPGEVDEVYGEAARFDGLGILPLPVVPHLDTPEHHESQVLEGVARRHHAAGVPYLGLRDGDVFVVDGEVSDGVIRSRRRC